MRKYLLSFCFILLMSSFSLGQITNGDFESWTGGLPDGWTTIESGINVIEETTIFHGGASSVSVEVTTGTQGNTDFRQTIAVTPGVEYTFKTFVYHTEGYLKVTLYADGFSNVYSDNNITNSWQEISYAYTPSSSSIEVGLRFYDQAGFDGAEIVYVDDFTISGGVTSNPEPTNHATSFSAVANGHNQIDLSWTDATGAQLPAGYLIKGSDVSFAAITAPVDGTPEADGGLVKNVAQGVETATITGLNETTQYFFKIFPFTNSAVTIDYKTDGTVPQDDATTDVAPALPNAWINEFHYDNAGGDVGEFLEIIVENALSYTLADFQLDLYNGSGGASYDTKTLDEFVEGDIVTENGKIFTLYSFTYPVNGIQNGPDGLALSYQSNNIQFISYEGSFSATDGPANGMTSTDIGIDESAGPAIGSSLGLEGTGTQYGDFSWTAFDASATPGSQNGNQALPVELTSFSVSVIKNTVKLSWNTATEINNYGFEIQRSVDEEVWNSVGFVSGNGTTNSPKDYLFVDDKLSSSSSYYYRLKQVDNDGSYEFSKTIEVVLGTPTAYELDQNYPNPFNPSTLISFTLPEAGFTNLVIYNSLGQEVATLVNNQLDAGSHQYNFDAKNLTSGIYFYKLESDNFVQVRKMMLLK